MNAPDVRKLVGTCMACRNWQVDVRPGAVSDLGGAQPTIMVMAQASAEHLRECPGAGGRVSFGGAWVERPQMSGGKQADGLLELTPLPRWWVTR